MGGARRKSRLLMQVALPMAIKNSRCTSPRVMVALVLGSAQDDDHLKISFLVPLNVLLRNRT